MFKFNFLFARKPAPQIEDIPQNFIINNKDTNKMLNISMESTVDDEFVNIDLKELSYADVVRLSKCKNAAQSNKIIESIKVTKTAKSSRSYKEEDEEDEVFDEKFKSSVHYLKHKDYKKNEKKKRARGKKQYI